MLEVKLISAKHLLRGFDFLYKFKTLLGLLHSPPLPAGKGKQKAVFLLSNCTREWHVILPLLELPLFLPCFSGLFWSSLFPSHLCHPCSSQHVPASGLFLGLQWQYQKGLNFLLHHFCWVQSNNSKNTKLLQELQVQPLCWFRKKVLNWVILASFLDNCLKCYC